MKKQATKICAFVASIAFLDAGYGDPGLLEPAPPIEARPVTETDGILLASTIELSRIVQTQTTLIHHEATPRQRQVAVQHVMIYVKHLPPEKKAELKKRKVRYIAVDTEKNAQTTPQAKKVVMIWDTHEEKLVGNDVYDLPDPPKVGATSVFETYSAEYVGSGN